MWLPPEPDEPFRRLTSAVWAAFPQHPPYEGAHPDPVPHLTVGERRRGTLEELRAAEAEVLLALPVPTRIDRVALLAGSTAPFSWQTVAGFDLPAA